MNFLVLEPDAAPNEAGRDAVADLTDDLGFCVGMRGTLSDCLPFSSSVVLSSMDNGPPSSGVESSTAGRASAPPPLNVIVVSASGPCVILTQ